MFNVTNEEFLIAIFSKDTPLCHVTDFPYDPSNIPKDKHLVAWKGNYFSRYHFTPNTNQYFTISTFYCDDEKQARRRKALYRQTHCLVLDDVREKLSEEAAAKLPTPSWILETSPDSFQWGYIFDTPVTEASKIDNLNDGLIASELAPNGKDPGQRGVTRYVRLPEGINNKASKLVNGLPFKCRLTLWQPFNRVTIEQLAAPFAVDLNRVRREARIDGASDVSDHPLINIPEVIHIKEVRSAGRFDCTCPWGDEHTDNDDSGSAIFTNSDGSIGYKCHHGSCQNRTGGDLLRFIEANDSGFNNRLKQWQVMREFTGVTSSHENTVSTQPTKTPSNMLQSFCANGSSNEMRRQMLNDRFVMKDLIIAGQFSVIYASPSSGKTLLSLWLITESIKSGEVDGSDVYYVNADDNYKGTVEKLELAEKHGFNMLIPNVNEFKVDALPSMMTALAEQNQAKGKVMLIDTVKAVTDLMDKKLSSQFGKTARSFVSAGGSIIVLAHVNKNKGIDGKSIHAGTSDLKDDSDSVYVIELLNESKGFNGLTRTVQFENIKARGNVAQTKAFQYTRGGSYQELFDSVKVVSKDDVDSTLATAETAEQESNDADAIEKIKCAITNGEITKTKIESFVVSTSDVSHRRVRNVLSKYEGRLWSVEKGKKNASVYSLSLAPVAPVSFI